MAKQSAKNAERDEALDNVNIDAVIGGIDQVIEGLQAVRTALTVGVAKSGDGEDDEAPEPAPQPSGKAGAKSAASGKVVSLPGSGAGGPGKKGAGKPGKVEAEAEEDGADADEVDDEEEDDTEEQGIDTLFIRATEAVGRTKVVAALNKLGIKRIKDITAKNEAKARKLLSDFIAEGEEEEGDDEDEDLL